MVIVRTRGQPPQDRGEAARAKNPRSQSLPALTATQCKTTRSLPDVNNGLDNGSLAL